MNEKEKIRTSRFLCLVLRHKPHEVGITLDAHGWADVRQLIRGVNERGRNLTLESLRDIVASDDKKRYMFNEDGCKIRACQGHSVNVDVELKIATPPELLYHGTAKCFVDAIFREGLLSCAKILPWMILTETRDPGTPGLAALRPVVPACKNLLAAQ